MEFETSTSNGSSMRSNHGNSTLQLYYVARGIFFVLTTLLFAYMFVATFFEQDVALRMVAPFILLLEVLSFLGVVTLWPLLFTQVQIQRIRRKAEVTPDSTTSLVNRVWWKRADYQLVFKISYFVFLFGYLALSYWYSFLRETSQNRTELINSTILISIFPGGYFTLLPLCFLRWRKQC